MSLSTANLNVINISAPKFRILQHLEDHWNGTLLHHLVNIPSVPIEKLHKQMVNSNRPINPFLSTDEPIGETVSVWTLFSHAGVYATAIGSLIPVLCKAVWSNWLILMCLGVIILHMIVCTAIHNCSSSGSLFFATLRQNNNLSVRFQIYTYIY